MKPLRPVFLTGQFWPFTGSGPKLISLLAAGLEERGARPTIVTARRYKDWPEHYMHDRVPVFRLPYLSETAWGTWRYMVRLSRWLRERVGEIDLLYAVGLRHEACAAISAAARIRVPVVLRAEGAGAAGDCQWLSQGHLGRGQRRRLTLAERLVAPSEQVRDELLAAGFARERIVIIPGGAPRLPPIDEESRTASRRAAADVNAELTLRRHAPLVMYAGRLEMHKGLADLIAAFGKLNSQWPQARLWLVGRGPDRAALFRRACELNLEGRVQFPGEFDSVDDLLAAADVFALPSHDEGTAWSLLDAMSVGLPIVACDVAGIRALVRHEVEALLVPPGDPAALAAALHRVLDQPCLASRLGQAARQRVEGSFKLRKMLDAHEELFEKLAANAPI